MQPSSRIASSSQGTAVPQPGDIEMPIIEVRDLRFSYGDNLILDGIDLGIRRGKVTTIMGGNGCGKSTLFNLMTKNLVPDAGKVFLKGRNIKNIQLKDFARQVAIVHQYNTASSDITVEDLVSMGRTPYLNAVAVPTLDDYRMIEWALEVTGTAEFREREVSRLSGGQRQRVWIALALAQDTDVLFLDEPTTYLDVRYQLDILDLVRMLNHQYGITIVMVLHDINQAIHYSDVVVGLKDGHVVVEGAPDEVISHETIAELFDIDLAVTEFHGHKYVLLRDGQGEGQACPIPKPKPAAAGEKADGSDAKRGKDGR